MWIEVDPVFRNFRRANVVDIMKLSEQGFKEKVILVKNNTNNKGRSHQIEEVIRKEILIKVIWIVKIEIIKGILARQEYSSIKIRIVAL